MAVRVQETVETQQTTRKIGGDAHVNKTGEMAPLSTMTKIIAHLEVVDGGWIDVKRKGRSKGRKDPRGKEHDQDIL